MAPRGAIPVSAFSEPPFRLHRNGGSDLLFDAFSSREPATTSLENALVTMMLDDHDLVVMMPPSLMPTAIVPAAIHAIFGPRPIPIVMITTALDHDGLGTRD